jgi:hypothetical protein
MVQRITIVHGERCCLYTTAIPITQKDVVQYPDKLNHPLNHAHFKMGVNLLGAVYTVHRTGSVRVIFCVL